MTDTTQPSNISHLPVSPFPQVRPRPPFLSPGSSSAVPHRTKFVAKGHDAQLQDAQFSKLKTRITLTSGEVAHGLIVKRDKFTITLRHESGNDSGCDEIFYKHAIEAVLISRPVAGE